MSNTLKTRISQKHDIEANWLKAINFIPLKGEIIVYDEDDQNPVPRLKVGNGKDNVNTLPFVDEFITKEYFDISNGYIGEVTPDMATYGLYFELSEGISSSSWEYYIYNASTNQDTMGEIYLQEGEIYFLDFNSLGISLDNAELTLTPFAGNYGDMICYYLINKNLENAYNELKNKADKITLSSSLDSFIVDGKFNYTLKSSDEKLIFFQWGHENFITGISDSDIRVGEYFIPVSELTPIQDQYGPGEEYTEYIFPDCLPSRDFWFWSWDKDVTISMTVGYICTATSILKDLNLNWVYNQIPSGKNASYVLYQKEQKLTKEEMTQARANIRAVEQKYKETWASMEVGDTSVLGFRWIGGADPSIIPTDNEEVLRFYINTVNGERHLTRLYYNSNSNYIYISGSYVMFGELYLENNFFPQEPWQQKLSNEDSLINVAWDTGIDGAPISMTIASIADWAKPYLEIYKEVPIEYITTEDISEVLSEANAYADSIKDDLLNGAGDAYDTLKELGELIDENTDALEALEVIATNKADASHNHDDKYYTETEIDAKLSNINTSVDAVLYTEQTLTEEQKTQARENIGVDLVKEGYGEASIQGTLAKAAGSMAFSITAFDTVAQTYTLDSVEGLEVGMRVSIQLKKNYDDCGTITEISGNKVKLSTFCYTEGEDVIQESSHLRVLDYPELGTFRFGTAATAFGWDTKAGAIGALAAGWNTEAHGKYSIAFGNTTKAGYAATALGRDTNANGRMSLAIGDATEALGQCTVAGGYGSVASADGSIAMGHSATADGYYATSRGLQTKANGEYSTALGVRTETGARALSSGTDSKATGKNSVAVGNNTKASGENSFAEGVGSIASSENSHAEGDNTLAAAAASHAQGRNTKAEGVGSSASGVDSTAKGWAATAEGSSTFAKGNHSHAGGLNSQANGDVSFAHGNEVHANGATSTAVGLKTNANGAQSLASGYNALADAAIAFAHGDTAKALGTTSVALGARTTAKGNFALAAPYSSKVASDVADISLSKEELLNAWRNSPAYNRFNLAKGNFSLALGRDCAALGDGSVALGYENVVKEWGSVAAGHNLISTGATQTVVGKFNSPDASHVFQVGGGTSDTDRKNAFWVKADGTTSLDAKIASAGERYYSTISTGGRGLTSLTTGSYLVIDTGNLHVSNFNNYRDYFTYETGMSIGPGDTITVYVENPTGNPEYTRVCVESQDKTTVIRYFHSFVDDPYYEYGYHIASVTTAPKFSGSYNDLTDKPTIPSIEGLATESYVDEKIAAAGGGGSSSNAIFSKLNESTNLTQLAPGAYVVANDITGSVPYILYNEETGEESTDGVSIELTAGDLIYCEHEGYSVDDSFYYVIIRIQSVNYNRFIQVNDPSGAGYQDPYNVYLVSDDTYKIATPKVIPTDYTVYSIDPEGDELSFEDGIYTLVSEYSECSFTFGDIYTGQWHEEWDEETGEDKSWYDSLHLPRGSIVIANSYSVYDYTYTNYNIMTPNGETINL